MALEIAEETGDIGDLTKVTLSLFLPLATILTLSLPVPWNNGIFDLQMKVGENTDWWFAPQLLRQIIQEVLWFRGMGDCEIFRGLKKQPLHL